MSGPDLEARVRYWLDLARGDLTAALLVSTDAAVPPRIAAGLAHQAAEKALKARLASFGSDPPRSHDLVALAHRLAPITVLDVDDRDLGALADAHIEARYPTYRSLTYSTEEAADLVAIAESVVNQIARELSEP